MAQVIDLDGERPGRRRAASADAVAAGALRASGERARRRRRTTPLLADLEQPAEPVVDVRAEQRVEAPAEIDLRDPAPAAAPSRRPARKAPAAQASGDAPAGGSGDGAQPVRRVVQTTRTTKATTSSANGSSDGASNGAQGPTGSGSSVNGSAGGATSASSSGSSGARRRPQAKRRRPDGPTTDGSGSTTGATTGATTEATGDVPTVEDATASPAAGAPTGPARRPGSSGARRVPRVRQTTRETSSGERLVAVADLAEQAGEQIADALDGARRPGDVEERIAAALAFLRRRLTGEYEVDEFGFDRELTETVLLSVVRPLYKRWFRVEVRGIENIPDTGGALVVANHSGAVALDSLMTQVAVHDTHPNKRFLRMLGADLVFQTPFIGEIARKGGATLAANADAERLLTAGEVVGVWPEGFKGIGKPFSERYKLQRFGRGGFVSAALRTRTPIVPCAIVGAEETYPIIGNLPTLARLLGLPYFPVTPTFPLLGPLGAIPLPSKWLIEFGAPVPTDELGIGAAEDPMLVFDLTDQVRQTIQQTLYSLLVQRRSVFF